MGSAALLLETGEKHKLHSNWCLWVLRKLGEAAGDETGVKREPLHEFSTVEDFWCLTKYSLPPTNLVDAYYCLFKNGVSPNWEDPALIGGGRWVLRMSKRDAHVMESLWLGLKMALIGENFVELEGGENIVLGASFQMRRRVSKMSLWLAQAANEKQVMSLGHAYHEVLAASLETESSTALLRHFSFEDFSRQQVTLWLPRPGEPDGSTCGIFQ